MKKATILWIIILTGTITCTRIPDREGDLPLSPYAVMKEILWADVTWTDGFWADKLELCREHIIPAVYKGFMDPGNSEHMDNLKVAAGVKEGKFLGHDFSDGDSYKWLESLAFMLALTGDTSINRTLDEWIEIIGKAQLPSGYISTNMQLKGIEPFTPAVRGRHAGGYHEMYNFGHLITAASTHYRATGETGFLDVACKLADHLCAVMVPGGPAIPVIVGNLPTIMALVDLFRITGQQRYLKAAQVGVDVRGSFERATDFTQDHVPFREENEAVGHAVFATYLYAGAADIVAETGDPELKAALDRIWDNASSRRTYITGAVGALDHGLSARGDEVHEAFGGDYQLDNRTAYNETCSNVGNAMWNWRMMLLTGDAQYTDMVEKVIYNSMLSAVSLDGKNFFYANPLAWDPGLELPGRNHTATRWNIHSCYCCPPQVARTIAGIGRWAYSLSDDQVWVHLYGSNQLITRLNRGGAVELTQETGYPWDGSVKITLDRVPRKEFSVMLRIPGWAERSSLKINGQDFAGDLTPGTYVEVKRRWAAGDVIGLDLPMEVKRMEAHPNVEDCRGKLAVMRGPVVYCAEFPVRENGEQTWNRGFCLSETAPLTPVEGTEIYEGLTLIKGMAMTSAERDEYLKTLPADTGTKDTTGWEGLLYRPLKAKGQSAPGPGSLEITLIPYFAWANRGPAYMTVWIYMAEEAI